MSEMTLPAGYTLRPRWEGADNFIVIDLSGRLVGYVSQTGCVDEPHYQPQCFESEYLPPESRPTPEEAAVALIDFMEPAQLSVERLQQLVRTVGDDTVDAHVSEDVLCRVVLRAIRDGRCTDPPVCAALLLTVLDADDRDRWWA